MAVALLDLWHEKGCSCAQQAVVSRGAWGHLGAWSVVEAWLSAANHALGTGHVSAGSAGPCDSNAIRRARGARRIRFTRMRCGGSADGLLWSFSALLSTVEVREREIPNPQVPYPSLPGSASQLPIALRVCRPDAHLAHGWRQYVPMVRPECRRRVRTASSGPRHVALDYVTSLRLSRGW